MSANREPLTKADRAIEIASRIFSMSRKLNLFVPGASRKSYKAASTIRLASRWIDIVTRKIDCYAPEDAQRMIDAYDIMHRIAYMRPADRDFLGRIRMCRYRPNETEVYSKQ